MDIARKKLDLMQRLMLIWDEAALNRVAKVIEKEAPEVGDEDDFTDEEIAELDRRRARHLSGESKSYTQKEAMRLAREGFKR
ncbi:MAG: hypothetical protein J5I62_07930 [Flavobacteriales bacterium]|nr:hypothetical protein [Flavobacteriales bacterium]MEB2341068.1 hypothetical protein [Flavobacteriia bacterium]